MSKKPGVSVQAARARLESAGTVIGLIREGRFDEAERAIRVLFPQASPAGRALDHGIDRLRAAIRTAWKTAGDEAEDAIREFHPEESPSIEAPADGSTSEEAALPATPDGPLERLEVARRRLLATTTVIRLIESGKIDEAAHAIPELHLQGSPSGEALKEGIERLRAAFQAATDPSELIEAGEAEEPDHGPPERSPES